MSDDNPNNPPQDWRLSLPTPLQNSETLGKFKDVGSLASSYVELEKRMGSSVSIPKDTDKEDVWNGFYSKWGRPEKHDAYAFPEIPKELKIDDNFGGSVKALAHKMGLNQRQFNELVNWGVEQSQGILTEQQKTAETNEKALKAEWGFGYSNKIEKAHKALAMLVGFKEDHPFLKYLETSAMGDSPEFLKFLLEVHDRFGEDGFVDSRTATQETERGDAQKKINEIRADAKHPYWNESDPRHADALKEMDKLYQIVYPKE